jgi:hypothetical protein
MKKRVGIYLPDGIGVRNYIYSGLVQELQQQGKEVVLLHSLGDNFSSFLKDVARIDCEIKYVKCVEEPFQLNLLRETVCCARLYYNCKVAGNPSIAGNFRIKGTATKKILLKIARSLGKIFSNNYKFILSLERFYDASMLPIALANKEMHFLDTLDAIICLHQRTVHGIQLFLYAKQKKIKTATVIYSWDNLPKARLNVRADKYFVWSEHMKSELKLYYPETESSNIIVSGTPQFSFYFTPLSGEQLDIFKEKYSISGDRKYICFSGDDLMTSPNDPFYLDELLSAIRTMNLDKTVSVIFRSSPGSGNNLKSYNSVISKYSNVIVAEPDWYGMEEAFLNKFPKMNDILLQKAIGKICLGVVNVGSSMAFDFACNEKGTAYFAYNQADFKGKWDINVVNGYQHFKSMGDLKPVRYIGSHEELKDWISSLLAGEWKEREDMMKWMKIVNAESILANNIIAKNI